MGDETGRVGAEETTLDSISRAIHDLDAGIPPAINRQSANDAAAGSRINRYRIAVVTDGRAADFDQDDRVVPAGERVGAGAGLRITVDQYLADDRRQRRLKRWRDRLHAGTGNAENNGVSPGLRVRVKDRLSQRTGAAGVRVRHGKRIGNGHRAKRDCRQSDKNY